MHVGIVGGGLAGLATAALLARDGHRVEVLERAAAPRPIGAGLLLQPPGAAILGRIGVLDALSGTAAKVRRLDSRTTTGTRLLDLQYEDLAEGLHGLGLTRPAIWAALSAAAAAAGAAVTPGCQVARVEGLGEAAVAVLADGSYRRFELIVVAAGTHATLWSGRPGHAARPYGWGCLWATVQLPPGWPSDVLMQRCEGTRIMVGVLPTGLIEGRPAAALYWSIRNDCVPAWRASPIATWRQEVARVWPEAAELVAPLAPEQVEHASYRDVWAAPPFADRLVVLGDAAHGTSPQLGQGTTQALRDALALAEALSLPGALDARLDTYWQSRRRRTAFYRLASRALTPVFQSDLPGLGWMRDRLAGPVGRIPLVRRQALLTLAGLKTGLWGADPP
ncbi:FAD-dependent oxidoreductase [Falsiroseomonas sp.]|uniref:FAD-dependent oxidoreductase n=1 Tax=Falsiroseomonas sp. TaxID=2870721 RepID=UPI003F72F4A2